MVIPAGFEPAMYLTWSVMSRLHSASYAKGPQNGTPNEIRTRVTAVKGRGPRPLDDRSIKWRKINCFPNT